MREKESSYLLKLNSLLVGILTLFLLVIFGTISYYVILDSSFINIEKILLGLYDTYGYNLFSFGLYGIRFILIVILWLLLYEIVRGFILGMGTNASVVFRLDKGEIYSKCLKHVYKKRLYFALIVPIILFGILPFILGFGIKSLLLLFLAMLTFIFNIKDIIILVVLLTLRCGYFKYRELGERNKFILVARKDFDNYKNIFIKKVIEIDEKDDAYAIKEEYITISKLTLLFLIILILLSLLGVLGI